MCVCVCVCVCARACASVRGGGGGGGGGGGRERGGSMHVQEDWNGTVERAVSPSPPPSPRVQWYMVSAAPHTTACMVH